MGVPVFVAIIVGLLSSFVQSFGLTLQRKSHIQSDLLPLPSRRPPHRRPLWLLGFAIYISSNIFATIFQLDALPIVILAPLGAVSLISNAILARIILGDRFGPSWVLGTGLVAGGAVMIAVFGVVEEEEHGLDDLLRLFSRGPFVGFFTVMSVGTALVLVAAHIASWHVNRQLRGRISLSGRSTPTTTTSIPPSNYASPQYPTPIPFRSTQLRRWSSPTSPQNPTSPLPATTAAAHDAKANGVRFSSKNSNSKPLHIDLPDSASFSHLSPPTPNPAQQRIYTLCGLAFAAASGTLSGMCLVLAKAAVQLLVITIGYFRTGKGQNEFARLQTWFLVIGLAIYAVLQMVYLNYSLTFASPAFICPLAFCFFNLASIFDGLVFYDQFGRLATYQIVLVSLGVAILLLGVWVVSAIQPEGVEVGTWIEDEDESDDEVDDDELEPGEGATLLGGDTTVEPDPLSPTFAGSTGPLDRSTEDITRPQPQGRSNSTTGYPETPPALHRSVFSGTSNGPDSPSSPLSPRSRHHHHHRHRGPRYGTLIPDLALHGAPTGFSIGLGAASPGFALRSGSISGEGGHGHGHGHGHGSMRSGRSRSEGPLGIAAIMRGEDPRAAEQNTMEEGGRENHAEAALRDWGEEEEDHRRNGAWWERYFGRGRIKLVGEEGEGDGGGT
ncbi:hypothetical protein CI109_101534 [Kwoniella shandongensis]|uniref:Uncharacterized protein n=1 Tax=Kwoniella shandongensis TaxID=1734106 RepID=A0A5M6C758_9TREE|nr:uncharacterized protein CI109_001334 [Kwoniella shandongensis]KAA5530530.1 hypothetical protein CI109_001334 [Kwoniella shandongensis]